MGNGTLSLSENARPSGILIVEDEPIVALDEKKQVESFGYEVMDIVTTGEEAIATIEEIHPDLILMDINLEGKIDGIDVAGIIRERYDIPVVFITAHSEVDTLQRAKITEPFAYLIKPYREKDLKVAIEIAFYKSNVEKQLRRYRNQLEELVKERTLELKEANLELKKEIAERKEAEKKLRESRESYRNIFENNPVGIYRTTPDGRILMANPALVRMLGYSSFEELALRNLEKEDIYLEPSRGAFKEMIKNEGEVIGFEAKWIGKNKNVIYTRENARAVYDKDGSALYYEGTVENITEKKEAEDRTRLQEQQLIHADKMVALGTLVSGVAHEINNPNNFVMLNVPVLQDMWKSAGPILDEYCEEKGDFFVGQMKYSEMKESIPILFSGIREGAKRIRNIVEELKDFARQDTSELNQSVDVNLLVKSAITLTSTLIKKSTRQFSVKYGKNLPFITGNFQRLEQVVINLIQNSCQALQDENRAVFISTNFDNRTGKITIKVKDEGIGMDIDIQKKITDPFFTTKRDKGGTGLGLSVSSKIVENHGGSLYFKSKPGMGTEAVIVLPVNLEDKNVKEGK